MSEGMTHSGETSIPNQTTESRPLFPGLVYNEAGEPAQVAYIGGVAHYAIPDDGFLRHVEASAIDSVIVGLLKEQVTSRQSEVVDGMLQLLGKNDLFTKAAIDVSIRHLEEGIRQSDPDQWIPWLRLYGFRIVVNVHGEVVEILYPTQPGDEE